MAEGSHGQMTQEVVPKDWVEGSRRDLCSVCLDRSRGEEWEVQSCHCAFWVWKDAPRGREDSWCWFY